ncbi:hypothetical protein D3C73_1666330 [compost metagenome]
MLACSTNGKRLTGMGFARDLEFCGRTNRYNVVPVWHNGLLVPSALLEAEANGEA